MLIRPTAKELKRAAAASKTYAEKFSEKIKATEQETVEGWKTHQQKM
jgi:hypothetical protein